MNLHPTPNPEGKTSFQRKVFWSLFLPSAITILLLLGLFQTSIMKMSQKSFEERYHSLSRNISKAILEQEAAVEKQMETAAIAIQAQFTNPLTLSENQIRTIRDKYKITHIFVIDKNGVFRKSTNENPEMIPNLFSFCSEYSSLFGNISRADATPIIPPSPEPKPYKFLTVSSKDGLSLIHLGMRVDFIENLLRGIISNDPNLIGIDIYSPKGVSLGSFGRDSSNLSPMINSKIPSEKNGVQQYGSTYQSNIWVDSLHPSCCQCKKSGALREGKYQYLVSARVNGDTLFHFQRTASITLLVIGILVILFSFLISNYLSKLISERILELQAHIDNFSGTVSSFKKVRVSGNDEITALAKSFNNFMVRIVSSYNQIKYLSENSPKSKDEAMLAHDLRGPLSAIKIILDQLPLRSVEIDIANRAFERINKMTSDVLGTHAGRIQNKSHLNLLTEINQVIDECRSLVCSRNSNARIYLDSMSANEVVFSGNGSEAIVSVVSRVLQNLVINSLDAAGWDCAVNIKMVETSNQVIIDVIDSGPGFTEEILESVGIKRTTQGTKKMFSGFGLGLISAHHSMNQIGGSIKIENSSTGGGHITLYIPKNFQDEAMVDLSTL